MPYTPGQVVYSADGYTKLVAGDPDVPLVMSAGHGGWLQPGTMPIRTYPTCGSSSDPFKTSPDPYTVEQVNNLAWKFPLLYGGKLPWTITFELHRSRVDVNRPLAGGACGHVNAIAAWNGYHDRIAEILTLLSEGGQRVLYLDLHGHGEVAQRVQVGFGLTQPQSVAANLDSLGSVSSLANWLLPVPTVPFTTVFRDLGTRLTAAGYPALPSNGDWTTEPGEEWYGFGYCLGKYDQHTPTTAGVQIELPTSIKDTGAERAAFSSAFLPVLKDWLAQFGVTW